MRTLRLAALALLLLAVLLWAWWWRQRSEPGNTQVVVVEPVEEPAVAAPRLAGREAERADSDWLAAAREAMTGEREEECGPYRMLTDTPDSRFATLCERIASALDESYQGLLGVPPTGKARGAVLVFAQNASFRSFSSAVGHRRVGYAGFSRATRGIVALSAEGMTPGELAPTLAHELTHLVNRRALGSDLPPWLAEGLADAIGDGAGAEGLAELEGFAGVEAQRRRLLDAYGRGRVGGLKRLAAVERPDFDRGVVSYDYEQSALLARFLLLDADLAPRFRSLLAKIAAGHRYEPELVVAELALDWQALEGRFAAWLGASG